MAGKINRWPTLAFLDLRYWYNTLVGIDNKNYSTTGTLGAGAITGTSFIIGANTLNTTEWAFLDGQNQAVKQASTPTFASLNLSAASNQIVLNSGGGVAAMTLSGVSATSAKTITFPNFTGTVYVSGGTDIPVADGGTGLSSVAKGSVITTSATADVFAALTNTTGLKALQANGTTITWNTSTGTGSSVFATSPSLITPTATTLGIGGTPSSLFDIFTNPTSTTEASRIQGSANLGLGYGSTIDIFKTFKNITATTNATQATHQTYTLATREAIIIRAFVSGTEDTGSGAVVGYVLTAFVSNEAGTAAILGTVDKLAGENVAGALCDATIDVTGATARVRVTGLAAKTIAWSSTVQIESAFTEWSAP